MTSKQRHTRHPLQTLKAQLTSQYKKEISQLNKFYKLTLAALEASYQQRMDALDSLDGKDHIPYKFKVTGTRTGRFPSRGKPNISAPPVSSGYQPGYEPGSSRGPHTLGDNPLQAPLQEVPSHAIPDDPTVNNAHRQQAAEELRQALAAGQQMTEQFLAANPHMREALEEFKAAQANGHPHVQNEPEGEVEEYEPDPEVDPDYEDEVPDDEDDPEDPTQTEEWEEPPNFDETMALTPDLEEEEAATGEDYEEPSLDEVFDEGPMRGAPVNSKRGATRPGQTDNAGGRLAKLAAKSQRQRALEEIQNDLGEGEEGEDPTDPDDPSSLVHQDAPDKRDIVKRAEAQIHRKKDSALTALIRQTPETGPLMNAAQLYNGCFTAREITKVLQEQGSDITHERVRLACDRLAKAQLLEKVTVQGPVGGAEGKITYYQDPALQTDITRAAKAKAQAAALKRQPKPKKHRR